MDEELKAQESLKELAELKVLVEKQGHETEELKNKCSELIEKCNKILNS